LSECFPTFFTLVWFFPGVYADVTSEHLLRGVTTATERTDKGPWRFWKEKIIMWSTM